MRGPIVGVVGGVGPLATAYFMQKVVRYTDADRDQDHIDMIVLHHASIPDRTSFLLGLSDEDPGPALGRDSRTLTAMGADFIVVPCNTAHSFASAFDPDGAPMLSIVEEVVDEVARREPVTRRIGLLATSGTRATGVYQDALRARGLQAVLPDDVAQTRLMSIIYDDVKAGRDVDVPALLGIVDGLRAAGAEIVVLGCTELSVVYHDSALADPTVVDSLDVLARRTVERVLPHRGDRLRPTPET